MLSIVAPVDGDDLDPDWAAAITAAVNGGIDGVSGNLSVGGSLSVGGYSLSNWIDYSSTFTITGSSSNPTQGNSTYSAHYLRLGKVVWFQWKVLIGSSFSAGSGTYGFKVPFTAISSIYAVGTCWINDSGTALYSGTCTFDSNQTTVNVFSQNLTGGAIGSGGLGTGWAAGDRVLGSIVYEAAS